MNTFENTCESVEACLCRGCLAKAVHKSFNCIIVPVKKVTHSFHGKDYVALM